ncbi:ATPase AAA-type core [Penicillium angulare]|uniref:ATPase AAA-type core n=1 Tax=Penicillium angulare TaxID=116970 RepID=UPI0025425B02|nr:ATPase AAA-type core [Penicillium angulare]KAJ5279379.1 ATPase AAA-type core [Penicillium angulare]
MADEKNLPDEAAAEKCEFKVYRHVQKKEGEVSVKVVKKPFEALNLSDKDASYALVINRHFGDKYELTKFTLAINSKRLQKFFQELICSYATVTSVFKSSFTLKSPFQILLHHWENFDARRQSTEDVNERMHLNLLFDFMTHEIGPERDELLAMVRKTQIKYLNAWFIFIFRPGDLAYTKFLGYPQLLRCEKTAYEENQRLAIITELPVFPRKFVSEGDTLETQLRERGQKFLALRGVRVQHYDGQAQFLKEPDFEYFHPSMRI